MKIGIDLGTTFSVVAQIKEGVPVIIPTREGATITPSVIQFTEDGILVGAEAKEAFEVGEDGCASVFKRGMGKEGSYCIIQGKSYTAVELSGILLKHLKEEAEFVTGEQVEEAVITVPAYFFHKERQATLQAAKLAGLKVRQIINEPTAAAMNYGVNHWRENARIMVYDLGGGTFDVTVVEMKADNQMKSMKTTGNHTLGGKDWDSRLMGLLEEEIRENTGISSAQSPELRMELMQVAESVKHQLSTKQTATQKISVPDYGDYSCSVTLEEFDRCTLDLLEQTGTLCENLLRELEFTWADITDVLLVGGSTRMKQVETYLQSLCGKKPLRQVNPDEAVALGAAIQVHLPPPSYAITSVQSNTAEQDTSKPVFRSKSKKDTEESEATGGIGKETSFANALSLVQSDVVAHAMGVIAINEDGTQYINRTIIPANQQIPVKCAEAFLFHTSPWGKNELEIYALQGTKSPLDSQIIGRYVVKGIKHNKEENPTVVKIQYSYDVNGIVHVQVRQGEDTSDLPLREESIPEDISHFGRPVDKEALARAVPLAVLLVIDVSGSMAGTPIKDACSAVSGFIQHFKDYTGDISIGLLAVSDDVQEVQELTSNLDQCLDSVPHITVGLTGNNNQGHPFHKIQQIFAEVEGRKLAIVLADGHWENQIGAIKIAKECHAENIDIAGVGFGRADKLFMTEMSSGEIQGMLVTQSELVESFGTIAQTISKTDTAHQEKVSPFRDRASRKALGTWAAVDEKPETES